MAVLLAVFAALAPAVSHALALERGTPLGVEICTSTGAKTIPADSPTGPESVSHLEHCPFCLHTTDHVALPPHPQSSLTWAIGGTPVRMVLQLFFYSDTAYSRATPRGPPALS
jgi:hypothetical protein